MKTPYTQPTLWQADIDPISDFSQHFKDLDIEDKLRFLEMKWDFEIRCCFKAWEQDPMNNDCQQKTQTAIDTLKHKLQNHLGETHKHLPKLLETLSQWEQKAQEALSGYLMAQLCLKI